METVEAIKTRRSVRKFEDKPVPEKVIRDLLTAAMDAPSAGNQQPWQFVVITDRDTLGSLGEVNPNRAVAAKAAAAVLVCGDLLLEKYKGFWVQDCSAATQNILLAAHDRGIGTVWTGAYPNEDRVEDLISLLDLPENVIPLSLVLMGYPAQELEHQDRFNEDRIHWNSW